MSASFGRGAYVLRRTLSKWRTPLANAAGSAPGELVDVVRRHPAVPAFAGPVHQLDPDRVARVAALGVHRGGHALHDDRARAGLREDRVREHLVAAPMAAGVVDDALAGVPHEHVGIEVARFEEYGMPRQDAARRRLRGKTHRG